MSGKANGGAHNNSQGIETVTIKKEIFIFS